MSTARQVAPVLMHAQPGGPPSTPTLTVTKAARDLHIDHRILAQPGLSLLACAVLAEVLDLCKVGNCFASDEHFAERCRSKPRTVRETIAELVEAGYLVREVNYAARHKRLLTPTEKWQILPEVVADSATTHPEVVAESAGSSGEIRQDLWRNLPGVVAKSANINTQLNTKGNTLPDDAACAAAPLGESEPAGVENPTALAAPTEGGAADVATSVITKRRLLLRDSPVATLPAFLTAWQAAAQAHPATYAPYAQADLAHYHAALLGWSNAEGKTKFDWLSTILGSMRRDAESDRLRRLGTSAGPPSQVETRLSVIEETLAARRARRGQQPC